MATETIAPALTAEEWERAPVFTDAPEKVEAIAAKLAALLPPDV